MITLEEKITALTRTAPLGEVVKLFRQSDEVTKRNILYNVPEEKLLDSDSLAFYLQEFASEENRWHYTFPDQTFFTAVPRMENVRDIARSMQLMYWCVSREYSSIDRSQWRVFEQTQSERIKHLLQNKSFKQLTTAFLDFTDASEGHYPSFPTDVKKYTADLLIGHTRPSLSPTLIANFRTREEQSYNDFLDDLRVYFEKVLLSSTPPTSKLINYLTAGATAGPVAEELLIRCPGFKDRTTLYACTKDDHLREIDPYHFGYEHFRSEASSLVREALEKQASTFDEYRYCYLRNFSTRAIEVHRPERIPAQKYVWDDRLNWLDLCIGSAQSLKQIHWAQQEKVSGSYKGYFNESIR